MIDNKQKILKLIAEGESRTLEFKESKNNISRCVYETVCAFLNRNGGILLLGVSDSGKIIGIDPECITQIRKDFITAINNPQKISPACYLSIEDYQINGKAILKIYID